MGGGDQPGERGALLHVELADLGHTLGVLAADARHTLVQVSSGLSAAEVVVTLNALLGAVQLRATG